MQFLASRPSTPIPFRPKRSDTLDIPGASLNGSPLRQAQSAGKGEGQQNGNVVDKLEAMVNGEQADVKSAGV